LTGQTKSNIIEILDNLVAGTILFAGGSDSHPEEEPVTKIRRYLGSELKI